jgi:dTDP-4-amino-4,6-dideoxygalactose transaminase
MHRQGAFANIAFEESDFEVTNKLVDTVLSLPMHPYLTENDIDVITDIIHDELA